MLRIKRALDRLTTRHLEPGCGGPGDTESNGEGVLGSPGVLAAGIVPKAQEMKSPGPAPPCQHPWEEPCRCACVAPTLHSWSEYLGFPPAAPLAAWIWVPLACSGAAVLLFTATSGPLLQFRHRRSLAIHQLQLSGVVNGASQTDGGWKPCGKSRR